jgi:2-dehydro-3-deoxy-D-gluconate 5-dehydrogenase
MAEWGPFDLGGKSAIVTGGAAGIGLGIALRLTEAGANVLIGDIDQSASQLAVKQLGERRGRARAMRADVTDPTCGADLAARCVEEFGSVDILVNNTGVYPIAKFVDMAPEVFDRIIDINLRGLMFTSQGVARRMVQQGAGGVIINIASIDGSHASFPGLGAYSASKAAVIQVTKNMALELGRHRIRVVSIAPGGIITPSGLKAGRELLLASRAESARGDGRTTPPSEITAEERAAIDRATTARIPLGRTGTPDDIGMVAVFLASAAAGYITGETVFVEGGILLK